MEQFRELGEVLGSLKALLVFQENIEVNRQQCLLLSDLFNAAYNLISDEMRKSLIFKEKGTAKWKILEQPLRDLSGIFREGSAYVRHCLDPKESPAKILLLHGDRDCVELHAHNLLACFPIVLEAIGAAAGSDGSPYFPADFGVFQRRLGDEYLIGREFSDRLESVWREDRWSLFEKLRGRKVSGSTRRENCLIELLLKSFDPCSEELFISKLFPSSILVGSGDYRVRRRLGSGSQYKEISWLGESFALRHMFGDFEPEVSSILSIPGHPNVASPICGFSGEDKKEWFLLAELMSRDLSVHVREARGTRKRASAGGGAVPLPAPVTVDLMLQVARGMEFLHSKGIVHGDLNPSNVLVGERGGGYLRAKVSGFGAFARAGECPDKIWHAPEREKGTEKSDVYSFGMVCFEVLTGKVPFEDGHLQGDKMCRNIRAGERPLFPPHQGSKLLTNLTKKCWHSDPNQRPTFSSLCRVLRHAKRCISMGPETDTVPLDCFEIESGLSRSFPGWSDQPLSVALVPFQMFVYRASEREKTGSNSKEISLEESGSGEESAGVVVIEDVFPASSERKSPLTNNRVTARKLSSVKKSSETRMTKQGTHIVKSVKPPQINPRQSTRRNSESELNLTSPKPRRSSGHASDSELP